MARKRRKKRERVYWRNRSGVGRAYGDFRDYADVGGTQEPLTAPGEKKATVDPDVARMLADARVRDLDGLRRGRALHGRAEGTPLAAYAADHLVKKAKAGKVTRDWLDVTAVFLKRASDWFGEGRDLASITVEDVQAWATYLGTTTFPRRTTTPSEKAKGRRLSSGTVRHALNALSNVYRRAQSEGRVPPGFNPVASMMEKPTGAKREARWLEVHEGALLLEAARTLPPLGGTRLDTEVVARLRDEWAQGGHSKRALAKSYGVSDVVVGRVIRGQDASDPVDDAAFAYPLLATFLLTGGRSAEVLGLEVDDVSFDRQTVTFRPNTWRRLKTLQSARVVPLWPQLAEILQAHILRRPPSRLLFPSYVTGREAMISDWRGTLDRVAGRAGWKRGEIRTRIFRHTYTSARLQTLDGGAPVGAFTVSRELGHGSGAMVERVYSHLGTIRHRAEVVEYRIEQHRATVADRLEAMEQVLSRSPA